MDTPLNESEKTVANRTAEFDWDAAVTGYWLHLTDTEILKGNPGTGLAAI